jgi:hypothetical protein
MKANFSRLLLHLVLILFCFAHLTHAQSKTGTTIGQFLLIEPSARAAAMGNAGVALYDEIIGGYYNPAAIGLQSGYGAQFTHSDWLAGIDYNYVATAVQLGEIGNLFFSITSLNSGEIDVRTVAQPLGTGERYTVSDLALGLGYGRQFSDRFSLGVQLNFVQETIWHSSLSTFAISVGTLYRLSENGLRLGASISNFGLETGYSGRDLRIQYDLDPERFGDNSSLPGEVLTQKYSLPVFFRIGMSWPVNLSRNHQLLLAWNAYHPNDNPESMSVGAEWKLYNIVALRGGYQNLFLDDAETGLTLGAGLHLDLQGYEFRLDYGWADYGRLDNAPLYTIGVTF